MTHRPLPPIVAGAVSGLLATAVQTAALEAVRLVLPGPPGRFPPRQVAEAVIAGLAGRRRPPRLTEPAWWTITALSHFGFGTTAAAAYPLLPGGPGPLRGAAFGLLVYALSYGAALPALGIHLPQDDRPVRKNLQLIAAHLAWGTAVAALYERLVARPPARVGTSRTGPSR